MAVNNVPHYARVLIWDESNLDAKGKPTKLFTTAKDYDAEMSKINSKLGKIEDNKMASLSTHNFNLQSEIEQLKEQLASAQALLLEKEAKEKRAIESAKVQDLDLSTTQEKALSTKVETVSTEVKSVSTNKANK